MALAGGATEEDVDGKGPVPEQAIFQRLTQSAVQLIVEHPDAADETPNVAVYHRAILASLLAVTRLTLTVDDAVQNLRGETLISVQVDAVRLAHAPSAVTDEAGLIQFAAEVRRRPDEPLANEVYFTVKPNVGLHAIEEHLRSQRSVSKGV